MRFSRLAALTTALIVLLPIVPRLPAHAAHSQAPSQLAAVRYILRGLAVQPPQQAFQQTHRGAPLFSGYALRTAIQQRASVLFHDGTTLHLNEQTDAVLRSAHVTQVRRGEVAEYLRPGTDHQVVTASAVASAIGTTFGIRLQGTLSIFVVLRGKLRVENPHGSVLVGSDQETVVQPGHKPNPPIQVNAAQAFAWVDQLPTPDLGENVALDVNGGTARSSSERGGRWATHFINDGLVSNGWESGEGKVRNQWIIASLPGGQQRIQAVIIDPAATHGDSADMDLKDFEIGVSSTGRSQGDFVQIFRGRCLQENRLQEFLLPVEVQAKYVELRALSNYGNQRHIAIAEWEVLAPSASFTGPAGIALDPAGTIYVTDDHGDRVVKLTAQGQVLTSWGTKGRGLGQFISPRNVAVGPTGDVYVLDYANDTVQVFSPDGTLINRWGTPGAGPGQLYYPQGIAVDGQGVVYVADTSNNRVVVFSSSGTYLRTFGTAGSKPGTFQLPRYITVDHQGNVYVSDELRVQKISPEGRFLPYPEGTCAQSGTGTAAPSGMAVDASDAVYILDVINHCLIKRSPSGQLLQTTFVREVFDKGFGFVGSCIAVSPTGSIYIVDSQRPRVFRYLPSGELFEQWGVFGTPSTSVVEPQGLVIDGQNHLYVTDPGASRIQERQVPSGRVIALLGRRGLIGSKTVARGQLVYPRDLAADNRGRIFVANLASHRLQVFTGRQAVGFFPNHDIFRKPYGVAIDHHNNVYVSDNGDSVIKLSPSGAVLATWGTPGTYGANRGQFDGASSLVVDSQDNVYVADVDNSRVQIFSPSGIVLGVWTSPLMRRPSGIAIDRQNNVYVTDIYYGRILKFSPSGRVLATWGSNGIGRDQLSQPLDVAVDSHDNVYVADTFDFRLVKRGPDGRVLAIWE